MEKSRIDTAKLRKLIKDFKYHSRPCDGVQSNPCTVADINKVIDKLTKVLDGFVDELEKSDE